METSKTCIGCHRTLPLAEFYRNHLGYYQSRCKPCNGAQVAAYGRAMPEKRKAWQRKWREDNKNSLKLKASEIRGSMGERSKKAGLGPVEWSSKMIFDHLTENPFCCRTGVRFEFSQERFTRSPWTPVPDRINPKLGYTVENVQWVCHMFNSMKQEYTEDEVNLFFRAWSNF